MCNRLILFIFLCFISISCFSQIDSKLEKKAQSGDAKAQYELAKSLMRYRDTIQALQWYKESAMRDYKQASFDLAMFYNRIKDYKEAAIWCEKTGGGYPWALLGKYYKEGMGVKKDYNKAAYWYDRFLSTNRPTKKSDSWSSSIRDEMLRLAECYDSLRNYSAAAQWYKAILYEKYNAYEERNVVAEIRAAAGMHRICYLGLDGNSDSQAPSEKYFLEFLKRGGNASYALEFIINNNEMSKYWLEYAVTFGQVRAYYIMGLACEYGLYGIPINDKAAYSWYLKSAENKYYDAYYKVALMNEKGIGTSKNLQYAFQLYDYLVNTANTYISKSTLYDSKGRLGYMYYHGYGTQRDPDKAFQYLTESATASHDSDVYFTLSHCYRYGQGVTANLNSADAFEKLAEVFDNDQKRQIEEEIAKIKRELHK